VRQVHALKSGQSDAPAVEGGHGVAAVDFGTTKISVLVAQIDEDEINPVPPRVYKYGVV